MRGSGSKEPYIVLKDPFLDEECFHELLNLGNFTRLCAGLNFALGSWLGHGKLRDLTLDQNLGEVLSQVVLDKCFREMPLKEGWSELGIALHALG